MPNVTLSFEAKDDKGNNLGDYEMFVDLSGEATSIGLTPPEGYKIMGALVYQVHEEQIGNSGKFEIRPSVAKGEIMSDLSPNSDVSTWEDFFGELSDGGFTLTLGDGTTNVILNDPGNTGIYEYLIWIQSTTDPSDNDFIDPGIRNKN